MKIIDLEKPCPHAINLTPEDYNGIGWLLSLIEQIRDNQGYCDTRNIQGAAHMAVALNKLRDYCERTHKELHKNDMLPTIASKTARA